MSEERVLSDFVWTPERGENDPEVRSISWNNLLLSDEVYSGKFLTAAEIRINPDTALQSTVFLACCRIISETVASLPIHVYRRLKNGHEEIAHDIPLYHVLSFAPNSWQTKFEFFEQMVMALTCWGNSYSEVNSGKYGSVTELNNLHPSRMRVERLENGRLKYSYNDPQTGRLLQYTQDQIMHVRWTPEPDGVKGMVPVEISRDAIALSRACEIYASKFWANMGRPGIVLQTDGALSAETAERLRDNWERIHRGVQNAYKTAVLTNGLKVESFGATNNDSQFLEVRRFQCEEICRCFRLPLHLVQGQSGGNLEIQGQEFINYTLMPWLIRIEQSISRSLIYDDATYYAKFDTRGLLRGDSNSRAAFYSTMLNLGILSINECRRAEGLGPLGPEADKHLVAMNLQPLEEAVKPKPDPSMMPGFGSGAPPKAPGVPPSLPEVKTGKAPMEAPKGEDSAKRAETRELLPQDEKLEEAQDEIAASEGKWDKESAHYIEKNPFAERGIKCHNCTHYVEEGGCKIVSGLIGEDAICKLWVIPQEKIAPDPEQRAFCATGEGGGIDNSCSLSDRKPFESIGDTKNSENAKPPTDDELTFALLGAHGTESAKGTKIGKARELTAGTPVALRIDIPAFNWSKEKTGSGVYAVTVHEDKGGKQFGSVIGYEPMARLSGPVTFASQESGAEKIASGKNKFPVATVKGAFDPDRTIPPDIDSWTPVGYDPKKAAYFYDKKTGQEVEGGIDAVSVGSTVFTREPKYGNRNAKSQYRSLEEMMAVGSWGLESRAFCPTGDGGGIDNSCGSNDGSGDSDSDSDSSGPGDVPKGGGGPKGPAPRSVTGRDVLKLLEKISQNPDGFTLDPANAEQPETGIMVSEFANDSRRSVKIKASEIKTAAGADAFVKWFDNNVDMLIGDKTRFVGGWKTGDDFYIDVATRFEPDQAERALEAGRKSGQLAVFNLGTFKETWVKYEDGDGRKPKEWDSGFARARKDAASKQVYDESSPDMQDEDWSSELSQHGKKTVRNYNEEPEEAIAHEPDSAFRHSEQADADRNVSRVPGIPGEVVRGQGGEARPGLVCGQPGGEAGTLQGPARTSEDRAFCPTGEGNGVDNSCSSKGGGGAATAEPKETSEPRPSQPLSNESRVAALTTQSLFDGTEKLELPRSRGAVREETLAAALTERAIAAHGGSPLDVSKPLSSGDVSVLSDALARDTEAGLERSGRHSDWYEKDVGDAIEIASSLPGNEKIASDPLDRFVFGFGMGILSAQNTVEDNAVFADALYGHWAKTGSLAVPQEYASSLGRGIDTTHFETMQALVDRNGWDSLIKFFSSSDQVRNIAQDGKVLLPGSESFRVAKEHQDAVVPRLSIFGPKIGPFTHAIVNGKFDHLVMDRWTMRQFGSLAGTLMAPTDPEKVKEQVSRVLSAASGNRAGNALWQGLPKQEVVSSLKQAIRDGKLDDSSPGWEFIRRTQAAYGRSQGEGRQSFADKTELNLAANNAFKNKVTMQLAPGNGTIAKNVRAVFEAATRKAGMNNVLATQALGWVETQKLWQSLGYRLKKNPDENTFSAAFSAIRDGRRGRVILGRSSRSESQVTSGDWMNEIGNEYQSAFDSEVSTAEYREKLVDIISEMIAESQKESRAFCPTGEGGGVDNSCGSDGGLSGSGSPATSSTVKIGDKQEEIDTRLGKLGVNMGDAMAMAGGGADGVYTYIRRDEEKPSENGIHIETTRDVAGVKDGMFSQTVIRNVGSENDPEIVVDHKLMDVKAEVSRDPEKRHSAARAFFRVMTESVESAVKSGASKVVLNAAGDPRQAKDGMFKGYTIWPRMGFDAPIPFHIRNKLPEDLGHCRTLLDLHATKEGTRWWRDNGTDLDVQLDLKRADSPQMQVFGRFVRHFERDKRELAYGTGDGWLSPADQAKLDELWEQIWDDGLLDDYSGDEEDFAQVEEKRAFCPTGEGGGIKNDCASGEGSLDNSWKDSDEAVEMWEGENLQGKPPIKGGEKLKSFAIENPAEMKSALKAVGVSLSDAVTMCASPSEGTTVIISPEHPYDSMGLANFAEESEGLVHTMTTKDVAGIPNAMDSNASLRKTKEGELILEYHAFHASPEAQEKASVACAKEVIGGVIKSVSVAEKSGVTEIRLDAAGDKNHASFQGYRIWPKFGFDGVIPRKMLTRLREQDLSPRALAEKRAGKLTIQALYETKAGQQYWEERGGEIPMTLRPGDDTTPGWARFKAYRERVGKLAEKRDFSAGNEIFSEEELQKLEELWADFRKDAAEKRAFCPTGEGNGIDNSCSSTGAPRVMMAPDGAGGGGWGGKTERWGKSSETEIWTPSKPLFSGAERFASIKIHRPNDVKGQIEDGLKMTVADAILAAGPISDSVERSAITKPRLEIVPNGHGIEMHWTSMGAATGEGYAEDEKQYAPKPGTVVKAVEATREIWRTQRGPVLHMGGLFIHPDFRGRGIGLDSVLHSTSSPVVHLEMSAERYDNPDPNLRMTGYKVWPKYGYDAPISAVRAALLSGSIPSFLSKARTISDVYAIPGGREWWAENGGPITLVFDRSPRSRSWQTMLKYADRPRSNRSMTPQEKIGRDSDADETVDAFWSRVQSGEESLSGEVITQEEYDRWIAESKEAKDGDPGEVQPH